MPCYFSVCIKRPSFVLRQKSWVYREQFDLGFRGQFYHHAHVSLWITGSSRYSNSLYIRIYYISANIYVSMEFLNTGKIKQNSLSFSPGLNAQKLSDNGWLLTLNKTKLQKLISQKLRLFRTFIFTLLYCCSFVLL